MVRHADCEMVPKLVWQNGVEVGFELIFRRASASGFNKIVDFILVLCHAYSHRHKRLDGVVSDHPDLVSQLFEWYGPPIVQKPDNASPRIDSFAHLGLLEHHFCFN